MKHRSLTHELQPDSYGNLAFCGPKVSVARCNPDKTVSKRTIHRLVKQGHGLAAEMAVPVERVRAEVTRDELQQFYLQLRENLEGVSPESVVNFDEVGFPRRSGGAPLPGVIPEQLRGSKIEHIP